MLGVGLLDLGLRQVILHLSCFEVVVGLSVNLGEERVDETLIHGSEGLEEAYVTTRPCLYQALALSRTLLRSAQSMVSAGKRPHQNKGERQLEACIQASQFSTLLICNL